MKNLLLACALILGTFSVIGSASAQEDVTLGGYTGWAYEAMGVSR